MTNIRGNPTRDRQAVAETIVERYRQRRKNGECRVDDKLYEDLCQVLPKEAAQEAFGRFRKRRERSDPQAEYVLIVEITIALHDADHTAETFKPIMMPHQVATDVKDFGPPSAANTYAKAFAGLPLTDADEDAVLFDDLLKDE